MLRSEEGRWASDPMEVASIWEREFVARMRAVPDAYPGIIDRVRARFALRFSDMSHGMQVDPNLIPSHADLIQIMAARRANKAHGLDLIPGSVYRALPHAMAAIMHPLMVKSVLLCREPVAWRGGTLAPIHKKRGKVGDVSSYRSVMVADDAGKILHSHIRKQMVIPFEAEVRENQFGGIRAKGTEPATHLLRTFLRAAHHRNQSVAVVFSTLPTLLTRPSDRSF